MGSHAMATMWVRERPMGSHAMATMWVRERPMGSHAMATMWVRERPMGSHAMTTMWVRERPMGSHAMATMWANGRTRFGSGCQGGCWSVPRNEAEWTTHVPRPRPRPRSHQGCPHPPRLPLCEGQTCRYHWRCRCRCRCQCQWQRSLESNCPRGGRSSGPAAGR